MPCCFRRFSPSSSKSPVGAPLLALFAFSAASFLLLTSSSFSLAFLAFTACGWKGSKIELCSDPWVPPLSSTV